MNQSIRFLWWLTLVSTSNFKQLRIDVNLFNSPPSNFINFMVALINKKQWSVSDFGYLISSYGDYPESYNIK